MKWVQEQWAQSNIISGVLALAIWGTIIALALQQAPIPEILYYGGSTVVGFFFGAKVGQREGERLTLLRMVDEQREARRG